MLFLVFSLTLSMGWTGAVTLTQSRIVGGWECERHSQPWHVGLTHNDFAYCGGILVHPQWVLTAAHCSVYGGQVWLGRHTLSEDEDTAQVIKINQTFLHPLYNTTHLKHQTLEVLEDSSHDIMLLHLSKPANITDAVKVVDLPTQEPELRSICYTSGWGSIHPDNFIRPRSLQCVDIILLSNDKCEKAYAEKVTEFMLCAGSWDGGKDTCMGDSGGPLICNGTLQGITSWGGKPCALRQKPALYTKLWHYLKWINETITANP
ncbi:kallikrein-2-like [Nycticebus coucang]|uniref:kallikrein-2-like n=1 Tax=Nycticebus coucang TaxID=9470 RepID=UPI00234CA03F|nr:kallikrein-2-like [Nycticebus coucang]